MNKSTKWIILILLAVVIITYTVEPSSKFNIRNYIPTQSKTDSSFKADLSECEAWASKLIPQAITLYTRNDKWHIKKLIWNDNNSFNNIGNIHSIYFVKGYKNNQNINYLYSSKFVTGSDSFPYSETVINEEGVILGKNTFSVKLTVKPIPGSEGKIYYRDYPEWQTTDKEMVDSKEFEVVDYEISNCNLIKDFNKDLDGLRNAPHYKASLEK